MHCTCHGQVHNCYVAVSGCPRPEAGHARKALVAALAVRNPRTHIWLKKRIYFDINLQWEAEMCSCFNLLDQSMARDLVVTALLGLAYPSLQLREAAGKLQLPDGSGATTLCVGLHSGPLVAGSHS